MEAKKNQDVDFRYHRPLFLVLGLMVSLCITLMAFEWKQEIKPDDTIVEPAVYFPPEDVIVATVHIPPPPPPPPVEEAQVVETTLELPKPVDVFKPLPTKAPVTETPVIEFEPLPVEPDPDVPFEVVEIPASFDGGNVAWVKFLQRNLKYPRTAKRGGIEGIVQLKFMVDRDGSISDIAIIRGIGGGCDEEAIRVLKKSPKWNPGKQRGRPVKSPMSINIVFKLH